LLNDTTPPSIRISLNLVKIFLIKIIIKALTLIIKLISFLFTLHHVGNFFSKLKQVNAVFRIAVYDLVTTNVREVVFENFFT
jgi:hypothetical protein